MKTIPKKNDSYKTADYWNGRYEKETEDITEWFKDYDQLKSVLDKIVSVNDRIVMLGCGNSKLGEDMYKAGYKNITNVDFSEVVIEQMKEKHKEDCPEMKWVTMDCLNMTFPSSSFDVAIDKGTMDAVMGDQRTVWEVDEKVGGICDKMCREIIKVLTDSGKYIQITFAQPHFRKPVLLNDDYKWELETHILGGGDTFQYFIYCLQKQSSQT